MSLRSFPHYSVGRRRIGNRQLRRLYYEDDLGCRRLDCPLHSLSGEADLVEVKEYPSLTDVGAMKPAAARRIDVAYLAHLGSVKKNGSGQY